MLEGRGVVGWFVLGACFYVRNVVKSAVGGDNGFQGFSHYSVSVVQQREHGPGFFPL